MGARLGARWLAAGFKLSVFSRNAERAAPLLEAGATSTNSPAELAAEVDAVVSMVRDDEASREVWLDPKRGAVQALRPGALAIEMSTLSPAWVRELAGYLPPGAFLEAPVVGSTPQAEAGALLVLTGGDAARADALFRAAAKAVHPCGAPGSAAGAKLAINASLAIQVAALHEGLALMQQHDIPREAGRELLAQLPLTSPALQGLIKLLAAGDDAPRFPIALVAKDLAYAAEAAGPSATLIAATAKRFAQAVPEAGHLNIHALP